VHSRCEFEPKKKAGSKNDGGKKPRSRLREKDCARTLGKGGGKESSKSCKKVVLDFGKNLERFRKKRGSLLKKAAGSRRKKKKKEPMELGPTEKIVLADAKIKPFRGL